MDDSIYRMRLQDLLAVCVLGLLALGVLMVQSAAMNVATRWVVVGTPPELTSPQTFYVEALGEARAREWAIQRQIDINSVEPQDPAWQWNDRGTRHAFYAAAAILTFLVLGRLDYQRLVRGGRSVLRSPATWALLLVMGLCAAVLVPGIGHEVNGARRWIKLGPIQVQPSELAKWGVVVFLAWWVTYRPLDLSRFFTGFVPTLIPIGIVCLLVVIQDFGTAALIALCAFTILLAGRVRLVHLMIVIPPALAAAGWFIMHKEYRWRRMTAFLDPFANPREEGYHMIQSLLSFATGGLGGKGLGNGVQKLGYLPEDTTDFIFAVICEELGFPGAVLTVLLYAGILFVCWQILRQRRDVFGRTLAFGIGSMIGLQAVINIAVATVSVPTKGLSLPLVSAGGTGLIITSAALGLLCSIARHPHAHDVPALDATPQPRPRAVTPDLLAQWTKAA